MGRAESVSPKERWLPLQILGRRILRATILGCCFGIGAVLLTFVAFAVPSEFLDRSARMVGIPGVVLANLLLSSPADPAFAGHFSLAFATGNVVFYSAAAAVIAVLWHFLQENLTHNPR